MLERTLSLLASTFPVSGTIIDDEWNAQLPTFCQAISHLADELLGVVRLAIPDRLISETKQEILVTRQPMVAVSEYRFRPQTSYYQKTGQRVPSPENPQGPDATGLALSLTLWRGYKARNVTHSPCLSMEFSVWGQRERAGFHELLVDHRRVVERLLALPEFGFTTACVFENLDQFKGRGAFKRLDLYYQNEDDPENTFTLERQFGLDATMHDLTDTLQRLAVIYDAAFGYCRPKKDKDRILDIAPLILRTKQSAS